MRVREQDVVIMKHAFGLNIIKSKYAILYSSCLNGLRLSVRCLDDPSNEPPPDPQIQRSAQPALTYDLFVVVTLGGLQHRKYLLRLSRTLCGPGSSCGATYAPAGVRFEARGPGPAQETGRRLLPVLNDCHTLMFDQDTNLLHSITDR